MSKRPHLLVTVVVQHRLIKHRNLPDEPLSGLRKVLDPLAWWRNGRSWHGCAIRIMPPWSKTFVVRLRSITAGG
jgi:hypothetical protein